MGLILSACTDNNSVSVPLTKTTQKETQILFSEITQTRNNTVKYHYLIQGYDGIFTAFGYNSCLNTFKIEVGKPYNVKLNYVKDRPIIVTDLCEMTTFLKRDSSNM